MTAVVASSQLIDDAGLIEAHAAMSSTAAACLGRRYVGLRFIEQFNSLHGWLGLPLAERLEHPVVLRSWANWAVVEAMVPVRGDRNCVVSCPRRRSCRESTRTSGAVRFGRHRAARIRSILATAPHHKNLPQAGPNVIVDVLAVEVRSFDAYWIQTAEEFLRTFIDAKLTAIGKFSRLYPAKGEPVLLVECDPQKVFVAQVDVNVTPIWFGLPNY